MFGLEGSGFVVCLGITLLLAGVLMFYVRQRFADQDAKLNQIIQIIPVMTQQIQVHEQELHPDMFQQEAEPTPLEPIPEETGKIDVSSDEDDSSDESDSESDEDEDPADLDVKSIELGAEAKGGAIASVNAEVLPEQTSGGSSVGIVTMDKTSTQQDAGSIVEIVSESDDSTASDAPSDPQVSDLEEITIPITSQQPATPDVNYSKLSVAALRQIVSERGLSTQTAKLKKTECLTLLQ